MPFRAPIGIEQGTRRLQVVHRKEGGLAVVDVESGEAIAGVKQIVENISTVFPFLRYTEVTLVLEGYHTDEKVVESSAEVVPLSPLLLPRHGRETCEEREEE